jgi:hypothetical protein
LGLSVLGMVLAAGATPVGAYNGALDEPRAFNHQVSAAIEDIRQFSWNKVMQGISTAPQKAGENIGGALESVRSHLPNQEAQKPVVQPEVKPYVFAEPDREMQEVLWQRYGEQFIKIAEERNIQIDNIEEVKASLSNLPSLRGKAQAIKAAYDYGLTVDGTPQGFKFREGPIKAEFDRREQADPLSEQKTQAIMSYFKVRHNERAFQITIPIPGGNGDSVTIPDVMPRINPATGELRVYEEPANLAALNQIYSGYNLPTISR